MRSSRYLASSGAVEVAASARPTIDAGDLFLRPCRPCRLSARVGHVDVVAHHHRRRRGPAALRRTEWRRFAARTCRRCRQRTWHRRRRRPPPGPTSRRCRSSFCQRILPVFRSMQARTCVALGRCSPCGCLTSDFLALPASLSLASPWSCPCSWSPFLFRLGQLVRWIGQRRAGDCRLVFQQLLAVSQQRHLLIEFAVKEIVRTAAVGRVGGKDLAIGDGGGAGERIAQPVRPFVLAGGGVQARKWCRIPC